MPRKAFIADLAEACKSFRRNNVSDIKAGEDDGQVTFTYKNLDSSTDIVALVPDLGEYPASHNYMFFTNSEHVDPSIHEAIDSMPECSSLKVADMLNKVARILDKAVSSASRSKSTVSATADDPMIIDSSSENEAELDDEDENEDLEDVGEAEYDSDDEAWSSKPPQPQWNDRSRRGAMNADQKALKARLRHDLRLAKDAGFRIAHLGSLTSGGRDGFVTLSIRVGKLGISEEALDAWHMDPTQYFILLFKYSANYQSYDDLIGNASCNMQMRVGLSQYYKVSNDDALKAFATLGDQSKTEKLFSSNSEKNQEDAGLSRLFIGRPLDELLNERLITLLRYRNAMGFPWLGAEQFFNDHQGRNLENNAPDAAYWAEEPLRHGIATHDHLMSRHKQKSFPLLAMQFALRHLVRCTEFCLVCHCKVEADFEALKPYVCSKPLCLYQYMSLGFGPSIEHEIITQPHVVDLLISFCYASAYNRKMKDLPTGMALMVPGPVSMQEYHTFVPPPTLHTYLPSNFNNTKENDRPGYTPSKYKAKLDREKMELIFSSSCERPPLFVGSWITIALDDNSQQRFHCRVDQTLFPTVRLSNPIELAAKPGSVRPPLHVGNRAQPQTHTPVATPPLTGTTQSSYQEIHISIYDQNFDDLNQNEKYYMITMLLEMLPSIPDMKHYLLSKSNQGSTLASWADRIPPAALGLLRWIIASNRSCIVQVDSLDGASRKSEERVSGMPGWMQFRFAQGAPDKEQKFITSIRETTSGAKYPTLFAWHGSPIYNWHGIVREGLHFRDTAHGRAYGHGVYHALDVGTSLSYSGMHSYSYTTNRGTNEKTEPEPGQWPRSELCVSQALALNEIVNAPSKYVSTNPYLVVAQLDWIQSRYLFVKINGSSWQALETQPTQVYEQDPSYLAKGTNRGELTLPLNAVSKSRRPKTVAALKTGNKKVKMDNVEAAVEEPIIISDDSDVEDIEILFSDEDDEEQQKMARGNKDKGTAEPPKDQTPQTDFLPGFLDAGTLQLLDPPSYATSMATKALQRELQATLKVQDSHPLHELGWHIDPNLISNPYQWLVELHSFESHLPLAQDMKKKGIKSIVMEIRFGAQYPMSPPFVRVIRPRLLSFMQGGGGHVTAGGALCMELLTNSGWSAVSNIESVLLQVRLAMSSTDPKPARLDHGPARDYSVGEAVEAFIRACHTHGWEVAADFRKSYSGSTHSI